MSGSKGITLSSSRERQETSRGNPRQRKKVIRVKVKKFDVLTVPLEVEYENPILGRLFGLFVWLMLVRVKKFNLTMNGKPIFSFYRLIVPRFLKGGGADEE